MDLLSLIQTGALNQSPLLSSLATGDESMIPQTGPHGQPLQPPPAPPPVAPQPPASAPSLVPAPTTAQLAAQQAPLHSPGGTLFQRILGALAPIPPSYKQMMSPEEQRYAQMQAISRIGQGLTGAFTPAGQSLAFGPSLARGIAASQESMQGALNPAASVLQLAGQQMDMETRMAYQQGIANAPQSLKIQPDDNLQTIQRKASSLAGYYAGVPGGDKMANAMAAVARSVRMTASQMRVAPADWWDDYKQDHPQPQSGTKESAQWHRDAASAAGQGGYTATESQERAIGDSEDRNLHNAVTERQRDVSLAQGANRLTDAEAKAYGADPAAKTLITSAPLYARAESLINQARKNPSATGSAVVNTIQALDPKAQVRAQIIEYMSNFDRSVTGTIAQKMEKWKTGKYPPYILDNIQSMLSAQKAIDRVMYDRLYEQAHAANPGAPIRTSDQLYGPIGATTSTAPKTKEQEFVEKMKGTP